MVIHIFGQNDTDLAIFAHFHWKKWGLSLWVFQYVPVIQITMFKIHLAIFVISSTEKNLESKIKCLGAAPACRTQPFFWKITICALSSSILATAVYPSCIQEQVCSSKSAITLDCKVMESSFISFWKPQTSHNSYLKRKQYDLTEISEIFAKMHKKG